MTSDLVAQLARQGGAWLLELAETGGLVGDLAPLRRLAWAHIFGIISGDSVEGWAEALEERRQRYHRIVEDVKRETDVKGLDPNVCHPLARNSGALKIQAHDELRKEIQKDVERTFPEVELMTRPASRQLLQRILFYWCNASNPSKVASESYRQGMNELAAVSLFVSKCGEYTANSWESSESLGLRLCGQQHTEADAYLLFSRIMELGLGPMFLPTASSSSGGASPGGGPPARAPAGSLRSPVGDLPLLRARGARTGREVGPPSSAILARCLFIFDTVLRAADPQLHGHLQRLEIEPQVFLLRWLRLLFSREFGLDDSVVLWDGLFADAVRPPPTQSLKYPIPKGGPGSGEAEWREAAQASAALPLVDYAAAALLMAMKGDLLGLDQTECLRRLLSGRPTIGPVALLSAARRVRETAASAPAPAPTPAPTASASDSRPSAPGAAALGLFGTAAAAAVAAPQPRQAAGGYPATAASAPEGGGASAGAGLLDPLRSKQVLSAAAQGAQGLLSAGMQACAMATQKLSEQLPPPPGPGLFGASSSAEPSTLEQLRRRAEEAEKERDDIKKKATEYIAAKKAEWAAQVEELRADLAERDLRIADLEFRLAQAGAPAPRAALPEEAAGLLEAEISSTPAVPPPAPAQTSEAEAAVAPEKVAPAQVEVAVAGEEAEPAPAARPPPAVEAEVAVAGGEAEAAPAARPPPAAEAEVAVAHEELEPAPAARPPPAVEVALGGEEAESAPTARPPPAAEAETLGASEAPEPALAASLPPAEEVRATEALSAEHVGLGEAAAPVLAAPDEVAGG